MPIRVLIVDDSPLMRMGLARSLEDDPSIELVATAADARMGLALRGGAAVTTLYLASTLVVTPFESDAVMDSALLSAHQQGQMVLSVFWGLVGVGTIVLGL